MNNDGSQQRLLINGLDPALSPDGTYVAFDDYPESRGGMRTLIMKVDGSEVRELADFSGLPSWSPDGMRISLSHYDGSARNLVVVTADGSDWTRLADGWSSSWSPDGKRIVYETDVGGNFDIFVINSDGSGLTQLTSSPQSERNPAWSPDGERIAFVSFPSRSATTERPGTIYVMNADGSNVAGLADFATNPAWSQDGTKITFASNRDGNWEIYVMNSDGSNQTNLTNHPADDLHPTW
jgi:Tol biopolymer transport system component